MSGILETFKLKKHLNLTVKMEKTEFVNFLESKVKPNKLFFFDIFDGEQKEYYGTVNKDDFWLRIGAKSITEGSFASANGKMKSHLDKTELSIKIIGWNWFILLWFLVMSLIICLALNDIIKGNSYGILIVFGPIFLIFYLIGFYKIRNGVKSFELQLMNELKKIS